MLGKDKLTSLADTAFALMSDENPDTHFVGTALLVVEVRGDDGETGFYTFCTDKRQWIQRALVNEANVTVEYDGVEAEDE